MRVGQNKRVDVQEGFSVFEFTDELSFGDHQRQVGPQIQKQQSCLATLATRFWDGIPQPFTLES